MADRVPSFFLLVPGPWRHADEVETILRATGMSTCAPGEVTADAVAVEVLEDPALWRGFRHGRAGPVPDEVVEAVRSLSSAAVLEVGWRLQDHRARTAEIGRALRSAGGVAVRTEGSGMASSWESFLDGVESSGVDGVYRAAVGVVADDDGVLFTCGMHTFGLPDVEVQLQPERDALRWLDALCTFMLAEEPQLGTGHRFRPDDAAPWRRVERWLDHRHHTSDGRHNPFGLWRLVPDDEHALRPMSGPTLVIVPSLVAMLLAAEKQNQRPLSQQQVEAIVDKAQAIAMDPADAAALERSRGYADIEPRRAWDQWRLVRGVL